ncbi:unnamed protein product [Lactuca saligna]|uniref:Receptor-like serine/threonine-protein kinase n=1 Tax=Lactuca saligna TaxID=75948 RepID=A0AA35ZMY1_LACSI|nr:unnamed protein product [Lactuca saligna]
MEGALLFLPLYLLFFHKIYAAELDIISDSRFLTDGDTLVSATGVFELGFFSPGSSDNRYLGIWYKKISLKTVVWVANRNHPLASASSNMLKISETGTLVLFNNINGIVWSSNTTSSQNPTAKLLDNGNLVVNEKNSENVIWQSFDHPTDTYIPGMKYGRDLLTGKEWSLSSWKSTQDPSRGEFSWSLDTSIYPQNLLKQGDVVKFRWPLSSIRFDRDSLLNRNISFTQNNETIMAFSYNLDNSSAVRRFILNPLGEVERWVWVEDDKKWQLLMVLPKDICDTYNMCNGYGSCSVATFQTCACLDETRFMPRNQKSWEIAIWSGGCVRRTPLDCKNGTDGFIKYSNLKLPDAQVSWFNRSMSRKECEAECLKNCTCMAYANTDIRFEGSGCLLWFNELLDIREIPESNGGQDIFVRIASSDLVVDKKGGANIKIILIVLFLGCLLLGFSATWFWFARTKRNGSEQMEEGKLLINVSEFQEEAMELPLFSFSTIANATARFSPENKLGEGGFGSVYKGLLEDGVEIAVKRLSKTSSQGLDEFKNEVICISKLQHRNLVKLLGCCIHGDEKLLIYEYMPNGSLDSFLFDRTQSLLLDWTKRFSIIKGIARGLLYLHQDSRLRIIHRDLKASNILLDLDMNPKIADFGMARSFGGNETQVKTKRVVGTYGYMSPEYALNGLFSIKSDVFSFGVLVLEIVSGKRNWGFIHPEHDNNLIGHAWSLYNEGRSMELVDERLAESCHPSEVIRSIKLGLLCVQQNAADRPNMSSLILMLGGEGSLSQPKPPAFFLGKEVFVAAFPSRTYPDGSINNLTITEVDGR